ncbi:MAG: alpha-amylase family glycosyl hydrolase [Thermodesulfobacteriota bacterium]
MGGDDSIADILKRIYGPLVGTEALVRIMPMLDASPMKKRGQAGFFSNSDAVLITYGDSLNHPGEYPLATLDRFAREYLRPAFSAIHVLPFFPYSSDDGFSVTDFFAVNPKLGGWDDIGRLGRNFELMADLVVNHISSQSDWFRRYLDRKPGFEDLALEADPGQDLSGVIRPRTTPLLTPYRKTDGRTVHVWTTFSDDQIDLNYRSPGVLEKMIDVLLFYVRQGVSLIRLDAIAYLWKEIGTSCIHLPQTHDMVRLFRAVLDRVAPDTVIVTETNVPHAENIAYFGNGRDEAQMVYNFTLPPLLLHAFVRRDATMLTRWARELTLPSDQTAFFNFTASHDGIGVRPLEGILPETEIAALVGHVRAGGGYVSCRRSADGSEAPYELNITYVDALNGPDDGDAVRAARFLASQAVGLVLPGVPGVYIHSLLGSRNWHEGGGLTGRARTVNRRPLAADEVLREILTPGTLRHRIFHPYVRMLAIRRQQPAFHPNAGFEVLDLSPRCFAVRRFCEDQNLLALTSVSGEGMSLDLSGLGSPVFRDLITGTIFDSGNIRLPPFGFLWLA